MKGITKRAAAAVMALCIVGGALLPAGADLSQLAETGITAEAAGTLTFKNGVLTLSGTVAKEDIHRYYKDTLTVLALEGTVLPADCSCLFSDFKNAKTIDLSRADTSLVTNMYAMFRLCTSLETLDISSFDTSNVTNMSVMFYRCEALTSLDVSSFNTKQCTNMDSMFAGCCRLKSLDLKNFLTPALMICREVFSGCSALTELNISGFTTDSITETGSMFDKCSSLQRIYASEKTDFTRWATNTTVLQMFENCPSLTGGCGTHWTANHNMQFIYESAAYACVDKPGREGYFTNYCCSLDESTGILTLIGDIDKDLIERVYKRDPAMNAKVKHIVADETAVLPANCSSLLSQFSSVETIDLSKANSHSVTNLMSAFSDCPNLKTIDLTGFDYTHLTDTRWAFYKNPLLETIYASDDWAATIAGGQTSSMFYMCDSLRGGATTTYTANVTDQTRARIDGSEGLSGYFTAKPCTSFDASTGTLRLYGYVFAPMVQAYANDASVKTVIADLGTVLPKKCTDMFSHFKAETIDLSLADTSKVTDMSDMFAYCSSMKTLTLRPGFIHKNVTKMNSMFYSCSALTDIDLSGSDITGTKDIMHMFHNCSSLRRLDLTSFDTRNITEAYQMFTGCSELRDILVSDKWDMTGLASNNHMFKGCNKLIGGNGTAFDSTKTGADYACIDGRNGKAGYLARKEVAFRTNSMTLGGSIALNFYTVLYDVPERILFSVRMNFTVNGKTYNAQFDPAKQNKKGFYGFTCPLNSISMADDVTATLIYMGSDGKLHTISTVSSAETYLNKITAAHGEKLWNLSRAINDYGFYMQKYLSKYAAQPWTLGVDHKAMQKAYTTHQQYVKNKSTYLSELEPMKKVWGTNKNIEKVSYSLGLDSDTVLNFKIQKKEGYTGTIKVKLDGKEVKPVTLSDGRLQVTVGGIPAHLLNSPHTLTITTASGTSTYKASVLSYAYECLSITKDNDTLDAMCALYDYFKYTDAYKKN